MSGDRTSSPIEDGAWDRYEQLLMEQTHLKAELHQVSEDAAALAAAFQEALDERNQTVEALHKVLGELAITTGDDEPGRLSRAIEKTDIEGAPLVAMEFFTPQNVNGSPVGSILATPSLAVSGYSIVSWNTEGVEIAEVTVEDAVDVPNERTFAYGVRGSVAVGWINPPPHLYIFRLYCHDGGQKVLLEAVIVEAPPKDDRKPAGSISCELIDDDESQDPSPAEELVSARVTWNTRNVTSCLVTVEDALDGQEKLLSTAVRNSEVVNWLQPAPHRYTFRVYDTSGPVQLLLDYAFAHI